MQMKIVTLQVGRWLVGAAWLWGSGVYGRKKSLSFDDMGLWLLNKC